MFVLRANEWLRAFHIQRVPREDCTNTNIYMKRIWARGLYHGGAWRDVMRVTEWREDTICMSFFMNKTADFYVDDKRE